MTMTTRGVDQNNQSLRPATLPSLKAFERKLDELVEMRQRHDHADLVELWRRAEHSSDADGYPASSMGSGVQAQSPDTSTESAALRGYPGPKDSEDDGGGPDPATRPETPDAVLAALTEAVAEVSEAHGLMRRVDRRLVFAKAVGESHRGRQAEGADCLCCDTFVSGAANDRLRAGFCPACWTAWGRWKAGRHEEQGALRREFIGWRRAELAAREKSQRAEGP